VSGKVNETLTAGGVIEVRGYNLRIEGDDPSCGLWLVGDNGQEVKATVIIENKPSKIIAMIPALNIGGGFCNVKVVTQHTGGGTLLKTPKTFVYPKPLTVS